jgi:hypothetical protein
MKLTSRGTFLYEKFHLPKGREGGGLFKYQSMSFGGKEMKRGREKRGKCEGIRRKRQKVKEKSKLIG